MNDIFLKRKLVHVKLSKDLHIALKIELLKAGLTMQEALHEFCRQYATQKPAAIKIAEDYLVRKTKRKVDVKEKKFFRKNKQGRNTASAVNKDLTPTDTAAIYNLFEENDKTVSQENTLEEFNEQFDDELDELLDEEEDENV
jgi:hypothetical protein